ncbi:MAG TPA: CBS domain-containing protein [Chloroflexota bacterium]|nr:CBS domain-containing protein [Chloroflexota bacterium]
MHQADFKITRQSTVAQIRDYLGPRAAESVQPETPAVDAVRMFCRHRDISTLAVVDAENQLVGILEIGRLIDDILADVLPEGYTKDIMDLERMLDASFLLSPHDTVGEMMTAPVAISYQGTAEEAFLKLHSSGLRGIPIVDDDGRVLSYLGLLEFMTLWMPGATNAGRIYPAGGDD